MLKMTSAIPNPGKKYRDDNRDGGVDRMFLRWSQGTVPVFTVLSMVRSVHYGYKNFDVCQEIVIVIVVF
jgi:hypothetical protein